MNGDNMRICPRPAPADFSALRAGTLALAALVILGLCGRARGMDESSAAGAVAEPDPVHAMVEYEPAASVARLTEQAGLMLKRKEFALAEQTIARGLQVDATYLPLWLLKAELALGLGNYEEAAQAISTESAIPTTRMPIIWQSATFLYDRRTIRLMKRNSVNPSPVSSIQSRPNRWRGF